MINAAPDGETLVYVVDDDPQIRGAVVDLCRNARALGDSTGGMQRHVM